MRLSLNAGVGCSGCPISGGGGVVGCAVGGGGGGGAGCGCVVFWYVWVVVFSAASGFFDDVGFVCVMVMELFVRRCGLGGERALLLAAVDVEG